MTKLNFILFFTIIALALGVITSQHRSRKLYIELQQLQDAHKQYGTEWGQLQLEQSTWAMPNRVELIARKYLKMQVPATNTIQAIVLGTVTQSMVVKPAVGQVTQP